MTLTRRLAIPIAVTLAILIAGTFAVAPLRDVVTLHDVSDVYLVRPADYVLLAPFSDVLDAITLLSERQDIAVVLGLMGIWAMLRFARPGGTRHGHRASIVSFAFLGVSIAAAYAAAALLPRPMAYLESVDPDVLRVDFHSHTRYSKDALQTFSAERNRSWHRAAGYDVAYVTDHGSFAGAEQGLASDPATGRDDVVLLPGIEASLMGEHVGVLGAERTCRRALSADLHDLDLRGITAAIRHSAREPLEIWNHPRALQLEQLPLGSGMLTADVRAIEVSNGAPHAMDAVREKRQQIVAFARHHNLALTSGTDNHGWGYAAPDWTLLRIAKWRGLDHDRLADQIEQTIRGGGFGATRVVERATADPGTSAAALAFSVVLVPWDMLETLSSAERRMWLFWTWAIAGVRLQWRRRRAPGPGILSLPVQHRPGR